MSAMTVANTDVVLGRVLVDEAHRQAWTIDPGQAAQMNPENPADASYAMAADALRTAGFNVTAHRDGLLTDEGLAAVDLLVLPHCADDEWESTTGVGSPRYDADEIAAIDRFVRAGGGLVVLGETEQPKYGNNLAAITERFGITIGNATVQDSVHNYRDVASWPTVDPLPDPGPQSTGQPSTAPVCSTRPATTPLCLEPPPRQPDPPAPPSSSAHCAATAGSWWCPTATSWATTPSGTWAIVACGPTWPLGRWPDRANRRP